MGIKGFHSVIMFWSGAHPGLMDISSNGEERGTERTEREAQGVCWWGASIFGMIAGGGDPPPFQTPSSCPISNLMFARIPVTPEPYDHGITDIIWQFLCLESCADA